MRLFYLKMEEDSTDLSILFIPFQKVVFLREGRALEVAKAVLPSHSPPGYAVGCFADAKSAGLQWR